MIKKFIAVECLDCVGKSTAINKLVEEYSKLGKTKAVYFPKAVRPDTVPYDLKTDYGWKQYQWDCLSDILNTAYMYMHPELYPNIEPVDYLICDRFLLSNFVYSFKPYDAWREDAEECLELGIGLGGDNPWVKLDDILKITENRIVECTEIIRLQRVAAKKGKDDIEAMDTQIKLGERFDSVMTNEAMRKDFIFGESINGMSSL